MTKARRAYFARAKREVRIKTKRIYDGFYQTTNTDPIADITREFEFWQVSWGERKLSCITKRECLQVIEEQVQQGVIKLKTTAIAAIPEPEEKTES